MGSAVAPLLLIAALAGPAVALPDFCVVGTPVGCDDGNPCTADLCQLERVRAHTARRGSVR